MSTIVKIRGHRRTRRVFVDGQEIVPEPSLKLVMHSPTGFNWGYGGSGPSQLALAILLHACPDDRDRALRSYQEFKWNIIANLPPGDFDVEVDLAPYLT